MNADDLRQMRGGFEDESAGSQHVFRTTLDALSRPGRPLLLDAAAPAPQAGHRAAALALLALLDADCSLWLSPALRAGDAGAWLRFHTGARLVDEASQALFLWVARGDAMPALGTLRQGSDKDPDQSATCVLEVDALEGPLGPVVDAGEDEDTGKPRLLVIEDNRDMQQYMRQLLGDFYRVELAGDGAAGLHHAQEEIPDLVICDVNHPAATITSAVTTSTLRRRATSQR